MVKCEECDKKLSILQGYRHPALGKRFLVCRKCFCKIDEDMQRWRKFYLSNSFNAESPRIDIQDAWNKNISNDPLLQKWFRNLWNKLET
jgi:hypothetical protein